jgi:adenylate kinase family enzyme
MIVGICGLAGSGKSTAAGVLERSFDFNRLAFADPLKSMLGAVGLTREQLYGSQKEVVMDDLGVTPRLMMQTLGTDWGREQINPDIWVKLWTRKARALVDAGASIVADDVRFPNEIEAIRALGGVIWRVERPGTAKMAHASENADLPYDRLLVNDGTEADLSWLVAGMLER